MPFRILSLIVISAVLVFFLHREQRRGILDEADRIFLDWLVANGGEMIKEPEITFLRLDDEEQRVFESWPLSRLDYAVILKNLERFNPDVIMVAPTLAWQVDDDITTAALRTQLLRVPQVLLGCVLENNSMNEDRGAMAAGLPEMLRPVVNIEGDPSGIPAFTGVLALPEKSFLPGNTIGFTHIDLGPAAAASTLKVPLLARRDSVVTPSFILAALLIQNNRSEDDLVVKLGASIEISGTGVFIPIDEAGYLNVFAAVRERIPRLNASALFLARNPDVEGIDLRDENESHLDTLEKNIVLIGEDHFGARQIPIGKNHRISRAELLALAIATIQSNRYISRLDSRIEYGVWAGLVVLGMILLRFPRGRILGFSLLLLVFYLIGCLTLFQLRLIWLSPVIPVALILASCLWGLILPRYRPVEEPAKA